MSDAARLLAALDPIVPLEVNDLAEALDAMAACSLACTACADACLDETDLGAMRGCIRTCLDCADLCTVTGRVLGRTGDYDLPTVRSLLETAAKVCARCADECEGHGDHHKHCRACAEACRRCEQSIQRLLTSLAADATA